MQKSTKSDRRSPKFRTLFVLPFTIAAIFAAPALAQQNNFHALEAVIESRQIIERAVEVYGGEDYLNGINNVEYELSTTTRVPEYAKRPSGLGGDYESRRRNRFQIEEKNFTWLGHHSNADTSHCLTGCFAHFEFLVLGDQKHLAFHDANIASRNFAPNLLDASQRAVPQLVVRHLNDNKDKLVWIGQQEHESGVYDVVLYPEGFAGYKEFHFSKKKGILTKLIQPATGDYGDVENWIEIGGYTKRGETFVPSIYKRRVTGSGLIEGRYVKFDLDAALTDDMFLPPAGYPIFENAPHPDPKLVEIAEHVFLIQYVNSALVIEFDDYVILVDAPRGRLAAFQRLITEKFGKKPIRFAVPLVETGGHSGGLREFVAAGIPILGHENDIERYKAKLAGRYDLNPDELARNPRAAKFESIKDRRAFDDGTTRLEFLNIGPVSVADDMLIAYLPQHGIVFSSDLFNLSPNDMPSVIPAPYKNNARRNLAALERAGLEVERIYSADAKVWTTKSIRDLIEAD